MLHVAGSFFLRTRACVPPHIQPHSARTEGGAREKVRMSAVPHTRGVHMPEGTIPPQPLWVGDT